MNIFKKLVAYTRWYYAIKKADSEHERTGERYYVIAGNGKDLVITNRRVFRKLKQKGYISRQANVNDMIRECFYFTPYNNVLFVSGSTSKKTENTTTKTIEQKESGLIAASPK